MYEELCRALLSAGYKSITVQQHLSSDTDGKVVVLRHDVDRKPENAIIMAELEHALGVQSTYYFRYPHTFRPEIIKRVLALGHEIGYHYEVLAKAKGNNDLAIRLFSQELYHFNAICEVRTICMHGSPLSTHDNRDLWKKYNFHHYGIEGEAYLSMGECGLKYFTDTGRSWDGKHSLRDTLPGEQPTLIRTTNELIEWISYSEDNIYLTVHPERWATNMTNRVIGTLKDHFINVGKVFIRHIRGIHGGFEIEEGV